MKKNDKPEKKIFLYPDHRKPMTRREFLAAGIIDCSACMVAPSLFQLLASKEAKAEGVPLRFIVFDFAGGMGIPAEFLVGKQGGPTDFLASYDRLGVLNDPKNSPGAIDSRFGLPLIAGNPFINALTNASTGLPANVAANLRFGSILHVSQDDTSSNKHSAVIEISKILKGQKTEIGLGMSSSISGGNTSVPNLISSLRPLKVDKVADITGAVEPGGALGTLSAGAQAAWLKATFGLSQQQAVNVVKRSLGKQVAQQSLSSYEKGQSVLGSAQGLDPRQDPIFQQLWNINAATNSGSEDVRVASIVKNVLENNWGPGVITLGGYDYHDQTSNWMTNQHPRAIRHIINTVRAAAQLGVPVMFQILTDGGISFGQGTTVATGDSGEKSATILGYFKPSGPPAYFNGRIQVGYYNDGQGANKTTLVGSNTANVAYAVLANYLNALGRLGEFESLVPGFSTAQLESLLIFT